jgi:uncharacterized phage protein (TIGR02220 family)
LIDRPRLIQAEIFPYYAVDVNGELTKLERLGFVRRFRARGIDIIEIQNFSKHQSPHKTEKASELPKFSDADPANDRPAKDTDIAGETSVKSPTEHDGNRPDSLIHRLSDSLIPDSLIPSPDSPSGNPLSDASNKKASSEKKAGASQAKIARVIDHLNEKTGQSFRASAKANSALIIARLDSGVTVEQCIAVIDAKAAEWLSDAKMRAYLRPSTLFNATKFESYLGALDNGNARPAGRQPVN